MKTSSMFWGSFLVFLGIFFLLDNFDILVLKFSDLLKFWPVLLIFWGITLLKIPDIIKKIISAFSGIFLAVIVISIFNIRLSDFRDYNFSDEDFSINDTSNSLFVHREEIFENDSLDYDSMIVNLDFDAGAGKFVFDSTIVDFISVFSANNNAEINVNKKLKTADVQISYGSSEIVINSSEDLKQMSKNRFAKVKLQNKPLWNINVDAGAAKLELNLKENRVQNLNIDAGVSDIIIRIGDKYNDVSVDLETGVSNIELYIPKNSGCKVYSETVLSNDKFEGFERYSKNEYSTANFERAENKIYVKIEGALSDFKIKKY